MGGPVTPLAGGAAATEGTGVTSGGPKGSVSAAPRSRAGSPGPGDAVPRPPGRAGRCPAPRTVPRPRWLVAAREHGVDDRGVAKRLRPQRDAEVAQRAGGVAPEARRDSRAEHETIVDAQRQSMPPELPDEPVDELGKRPGGGHWGSCAKRARRHSSTLSWSLRCLTSAPAWGSCASVAAGLSIAWR